jgi:hypothetical protein
MISQMPRAPKRNAAKIRSGTCNSDNNEDGFVVFDRRVIAGDWIYIRQARLANALPKVRGRTDWGQIAGVVSKHLTFPRETLKRLKDVNLGSELTIDSLPFRKFTCVDYKL